MKLDSLKQVADYVKNKYPGQTVTDIGLEMQRNFGAARRSDGVALRFDEHNLRQHMAGHTDESSGDRMMRHHGNSR